MATSQEQLDAMRKLPENWDGYGAAVPEVSAIELAKEFVGLLEAALKKSAFGLPAMHVSPTRIGGVLIEWEEPAMEHEVEINPDGSIGFLHLCKSSGFIETRKFSNARVDRGLLQELRALLAA